MNKWEIDFFCKQPVISFYPQITHTPLGEQFASLYKEPQKLLSSLMH